MDQLDRALGQLKDEYSPDPDAEGRVRKRIAASLALASTGLAAGSLAAGSLSGSGSTLSASAGGAGSAMSGVTLKLLASAVVLGGFGWAGLNLAPSEPPDQPAEVVSSSPAPPAHQPSLREAEELRPDQEDGEERVKSEGTAANDPPSAGTEATPRPAPQPPESGESQQAGGTSLKELRLLRRASQALRDGRLAEASGLLSEHREHYPDSVLQQERRGLSLLAQCAGGTSEQLRARAERFVSSYPDLPVSEPIKKQCLK